MNVSLFSKTQFPPSGITTHATSLFCCSLLLLLSGCRSSSSDPFVPCNKDLCLAQIPCNPDNDTCQTDPEGKPYQCGKATKTCILFDQYHARKQNFTDYRLTKTTYQYVGLYAFARFADHLREHTYATHTIRTKPLTKEQLKSFDVLFINLVDNSRPDFTQVEIEAIIDFVNKGGGLFVVADHTNVYDHAERINQFLMPMGIEVLYHTAVDFPPEYSVGGIGWIKTSHLKTHPVTEGVQEICLQTGGPITTPGGSGDLAITSNKSFGDFWNKASGEGYYGDWKLNDNPSGDKHQGDFKGPLNVYAAHTYGKGRIVVAGDQNMFGDPWLFYLDNFKIAMNSIEWLSRRETDSPHLRDTTVHGLQIALNQSYTGYNAGNDIDSSYFSYRLYAHRDPDVTMAGSLRIGNEHVIQFGNLTKPIPTDELATIKRRLHEGASVVIGFEPQQVSAHTFALIKALDPTFTLQTNGKEFTLNDAHKLSSEPHTLLYERRAVSSAEGLLLNDTPISAWTENPNQYPTDRGVQQNDPTIKGALGQENEHSRPYLYKVTSSWGDNFIQTRRDSYTIARKKEIGKGELILFLQDGLLKTKSIGYDSMVPNAYTAPQVELVYQLLEYWKRKHRLSLSST